MFDQVLGGVGSMYVGVMVSIGVLNVSFSDMVCVGLLNLLMLMGLVEMYVQSVGGYWICYLFDGIYFDSVGQVMYYGNCYCDSYGNEVLQNGFGVVLLQEVGKLFVIGMFFVVIELQVQLMY